MSTSPASDIHHSHKALISLIRDTVAKLPTSDLTRTLGQMSDHQLAGMMFYNARRTGDTPPRRLTRYGLTVVQTFFSGYEIKRNEGHPLLGRHILFLDRQCTLPYYCDDAVLIVFDQHLGPIMHLANGDIEQLILMFGTD